VVMEWLLEASVLWVRNHLSFDGTTDRKNGDGSDFILSQT
jgi:hypothetical protein